MTLKRWEKKVLEAPGATQRVAEIEEELRLAAGLTALREQCARPGRHRMHGRDRLIGGWP